MSLISIFLSYTAVAPVWRPPPAGALAPTGPGRAFALALALPVTAKSRQPAELLREPDDATRNGPGWGRGSTPKTQTLDQRVVALVVPGLEVVEQTPTLADHLEQTATRMVILRVALEVLGEVGDAFAQDGDLNFRRARVVIALGIRLDELRLARGRNRHRLSP